MHPRAGCNLLNISSKQKWKILPKERLSFLPLQYEPSHLTPETLGYATPSRRHAVARYTCTRLCGEDAWRSLTRSSGTKRRSHRSGTTTDRLSAVHRTRLPKGAFTSVRWPARIRSGTSAPSSSHQSRSVLTERSSDSLVSRARQTRSSG